jgi:endonuclease VIII
MPEGDSYTRAAAKLRPALVGRRLIAVDGAPAVRKWSARLTDRRVEGVRTHGKHLLIDVEGDVAIHVWLGMPGRWRIGPNRGRWVREGEAIRGGDDPGAIRLRLQTETHTAICYSAPTVEVDRRSVVDRSLRRLGPDVLAEELDLAEVLARAALLPGDTSAADLLLDQRVMSGVGNEYKNETLFLEGVHPRQHIGSLPAGGIVRLVERARALMLPNATRSGPRATGRMGGGTWVFERTGLPCRRCRTAIVQEAVGARHPRVSYLCPVCQPVGAPATTG